MYFGKDFQMLEYVTVYFYLDEVFVIDLTFNVFVSDLIFVHAWQKTLTFAYVKDGKSSNSRPNYQIQVWVQFLHIHQPAFPFIEGHPN